MEKHMLSNVAFGAYSMPVEGGGGSQSMIDSLTSLGSNVYGLVSSAAAAAGDSITQLATRAANWTESNTTETYHDFVDFVERRRILWAKINDLQEGPEKENLLAEFRSGETFVQGTLLPLGAKFFEYLGYPKPDTNLGAFPVIGMALVAAGTYVAIKWMSRHYDAIENNPALADTGITGGIAKGVQGLMWAVGIVAAIAFVVPMIKAKAKG